MKQFGVQMIDYSISSQWWRTIIRHFIKEGDAFEIRSWKEEADEIMEASLYGTATKDGYEVSIKGRITKTLLEKLLTDEPSDKNIPKLFTEQYLN